MRIYLDHNATTPLCPESAEALLRWLGPGAVANASSLHAEGRSARAALDRSREQVAAAIGASTAKEVIFTSGATEANATLIRGAGGHLVTTAVEHPSVLLPAGASGAELVRVDGLGRVDLDALDQALRFGPALCSVLWANNETGVLQDVEAIAQMCRAREVPLHLDAAQALGRIPVDVAALGCDYATFSAHKAYGPPGIGALWVRAGAPLDPLLAGGHQERGRRAGTQSVALVVGFGAAAARIPALLDRMGRVEALRDRLWFGLRDLGGARHGGDDRLPNTLSVRLPGVTGETLLMALDMAGISISAGSACTAGSLEPSHVLRAMGLTEDEALGAVRFSLGAGTTAQEIDRVLAVVSDALPRLRQAAS